LHDYRARYYDPAIARFTTIAPLADQDGQASWNPYHYALNNPILHDYIDNFSVSVTDSKGNKSEKDVNINVFAMYDKTATGEDAATSYFFAGSGEYNDENKSTNFW